MRLEVKKYLYDIQRAEEAWLGAAVSRNLTELGFWRGNRNALR